MLLREKEEEVLRIRKVLLMDPFRWTNWLTPEDLMSYVYELCLPPARVGRNCFSPCVCVSVSLCVCLSVTKSCPLYNLITVTDISTKLHTIVKHIETMCHAQEP